MSDLWSSIAILAKALGSDWAMALADRMDATDQPTDLPRRVREIGASGYSSIAAETSMRWSSTDSYSAKEVAAALRGAASMLSHLNASESIDIVWTGPESPFVATRRTEQVLQQIIRSAKKTLTLISFIFVNPGGLADDLRAASDRGVKIIGIFEPPAHRGGGRKDLTIDSVVNLQAIVPRAECYEWPQDLKIAHGAPSTSVIHAKAAIADETQAFVTSANLTGAAMETNMELGIRMVGSTAASRLQKLITSLIETGCVRRFTI